MTLTSTEGPSMTVTQHTDVHHSEPPHPSARDHAHRVAAIASIAESQLRESEDERAERSRLADGLVVLRTLLTLPWSERVLEVDRVLHDEKGDLDESRVVEYLGLLLDEEQRWSSLQVRQSMVRRRAQAVIGDAWEVAQHLHGMADAALARQAPREASPVHRGELPPAATVPAQKSEPEALPQRMPERPATVPEQRGPQPSQPPMFPPAPPESTAEQTSELVAHLRESGVTISPETEASMRKDGKSTPPAMGPAAPAEFGASAVPQMQFSAQSGDTQRLPVIKDESAHAAEVLAELAMDDASAELDSPEPLPFVRAPHGASLPAGPSRSGSGGDDDA